MFGKKFVEFRNGILEIELLVIRVANEVLSIAGAVCLSEAANIVAELFDGEGIVAAQIVAVGRPVLLVAIVAVGANGRGIEVSFDLFHLSLQFLDALIS